jgi:aminopeptidase N
LRLSKALDRPALVLDWRPELDVADAMRTVRSIRVNGRRDARCEFREGHLHVPARALTPGVNCIELEWSARIRESASALTRYRDSADGAVYVYSLFVPADASTVFPCFDQPDVKARFSLALTVPSSWHALANAPLVTSERVRGGRKLVFAATEPISTYAFAFAAGPFVALGRPADPTLVWVRRSQRSRAQRHLTDILRLNAAAVRYCTRYFGHPFPFRKYDLALIPQFPYRGMEHAGATFLNEDAVLLPQPHGPAARLQRAQLIFHETTHQWIGDLVTMRWFDDLWIKEGYANFIAFKLAERAISRAYARLAFHDLKLGA